MCHVVSRIKPIYFRINCLFVDSTVNFVTIGSDGRRYIADIAVDGEGQSKPIAVHISLNVSMAPFFMVLGIPWMIISFLTCCFSWVYSCMSCWLLHSHNNNEKSSVYTPICDSDLAAIYLQLHCVNVRLEDLFSLIQLRCQFFNQATNFFQCIRHDVWYFTFCCCYEDSVY